MVRMACILFWTVKVQFVRIKCIKNNINLGCIFYLGFFHKKNSKTDLENIIKKIQILDKFNSRKLFFENMRFFFPAIKIFYFGELQKILPHSMFIL